MIKRYLHDITIALEAILSNKLKSILTALGIIFGVAAVISMLAIGNGAKQEILEQMKMVGVNNIIINPIFEEQDEQQAEGENGKKQNQKFSPGLTALDLKAIKDIVPSVKSASSEISLNSFVQYEGLRMPAKIMGVSTDYFDLYNLPLDNGTYFSKQQEEHGIPVCVIGSNIKTKFFGKVDPIGQYIKFGSVWLQVVGVIKKNDVKVTGFENAGVSVYNDNVYIPVNTMLLRYKNRSVINSQKLQSSSVGGGGFFIVSLAETLTRRHPLTITRQMNYCSGC